jgi:hypothetical protein
VIAEKSYLVACLELLESSFDSFGSSNESANLLRLFLIDFSLSIKVSLVTSYSKVYSKLAPYVLR